MVVSTGQSLREEKAGGPQPQAVSPGLYKMGLMDRDRTPQSCDLGQVNL